MMIGTTPRRLIDRGAPPRALLRAGVVVAVVVLAAAASSCMLGLTLLLRGLLVEGPDFYNGQECRMTYSQFVFLPLRVALPSSSTTTTTTTSSAAPWKERYRLLKFTDARDPRHGHLYPVSGSMAEDYRRSSSSSSSTSENDRDDDPTGRLLEMTDNWCLLRRDQVLREERDGEEGTTMEGEWTEAPHPHPGHPVVYVPGHWGSYSQSRSLGAHGTRWTGQQHQRRRNGDAGMSDRDVYESLRTGGGMMHDGLGMRPPPHYGDDDYSGTGRGNNNATAPAAAVEDVVDWLSSLSNRRSSSHHNLDGFVMDVYALDFDGEGAALHSSTLVRQADFFARAVRTIAEGCRLPPPPPPTTTGVVGRKKPPGGGEGGGGITIVAHSVGALVVRMALKAHPELSGDDGWIRNVVTLASPLGSDFPYAVDAGVHDAARRINDGMRADGIMGDVTMISISGGLRDEMIPPEACQVPSIPRRDVDEDEIEENASGFVSSAFLASTIMRGGASTTGNDTFGMDHRAIVWCHDLLAVVRELIFSLVIATDNGLLSSERMNVASRMMHGATAGVGIDDPRRNESDATVYQEQVNQQHVRLLLEKGYLRTVSIQLSAPYYLNSLLKLSIAAALLDTLTIFPTRKSKSLVDASFEMALSLIAIPSLVVMVTWVRQSGHYCSVQECQLLSGTVFILSQLATLVYFVIVRGLCPLVAAIFRPSFDVARAESFWGIFARLIVEQLRMLVLVLLPLTITACFIINTFILGTEDLAWNYTAIASYCFISCVLHNLISLVILATHSPSVIEQRRREIFVLFLSLVKSTLGTMLYALSLTTHWGQRDLDFYYGFLTVANIRTGFICGCSNVLSMSVLTIVLPLFLAINVFRTHDVMTRISLFHWRQAKQKAGNGDSANESTKMLWSYESKYITAVRAFLICWFTWTASVNMAADDIVVPISVVIMTYLRCLPFSVQAMGVCSLVINNDLSLRSHDKHK